MLNFKMSNAVYEFVKKLVRIYLPAFSALYFGLAQIWGLPAAEQIVGSIALFTTFLGVCLGISNSNYEGDGVVRTETNEDTGVIRYSIELAEDVDPYSIPDRDQLVLKIAN